MSGRGDNNKNGSAGRGASDQRGQGLQTGHEKTNHGKQKEGQPSQPQPKHKDQEAHRNTSKQERG